MNIIGWVIFGTLLGWLASLIMKTDQDQNRLLNTIIGILCAFLVVMLLFPILGANVTTKYDFGLSGPFIPFFGAIVLLGLVAVVRREWR